MDHGRAALMPFADLLEEWIDLIEADAEALGCHTEVVHARRIAREGTSADRQRAAWQRARAEGADEPEALRAVVDALVAEFTGGRVQ